jgi:hypothetical protein
MLRPPAVLVSLAAGLAAAACTDVTNAPADDPAAGLDENVFHCNVEPILAADCSYAACHGIAGAALRVYRPGLLRATTPASMDQAIAPLTTAERHANFVSAAGFAFGGTAPDDNYLLRKPLPAPDGGYEHFGGAIYVNGTDDARYKTIHDWLSGKGTCP